MQAAASRPYPRVVVACHQPECRRVRRDLRDAGAPLKGAACLDDSPAVAGREQYERMCLVTLSVSSIRGEARDTCS